MQLTFKYTLSVCLSSLSVHVCVYGWVGRGELTSLPHTKYGFVTLFKASVYEIRQRHKTSLENQTLDSLFQHADSMTHASHSTSTMTTHFLQCFHANPQTL